MVEQGIKRSKWITGQREWDTRILIQRHLGVLTFQLLVLTLVIGFVIKEEVVDHLMVLLSLEHGTLVVRKSIMQHINTF